MGKMQDTSAVLKVWGGGQAESSQVRVMVSRVSVVIELALVTVISA